MTNEQLPETIGRYQIQELLGRGGMGLVYLAHDPSLDREVAIKVLPPDLAGDDEVRQRFLDEARNAARLTHEGIVRVYDVGESEGGPYFVMMRVQGGDLGDLLARRGTLSPPEAKQLLAQLADAIDQAHRQGVVHRDLKPENVLITEQGKALLTDFGIARAADGTGRGLTRTGMLIGTPEYMSPEQAHGEQVDHRSDLYSFGVIAYRVLAGQVPFSGDNPIAVALRHVKDPPPVPELPAPMVAALMRMLAKDPHYRFGSATEFVQALLEPSGQAPVEHPLPTVAIPAPAPPLALASSPTPRTGSRSSLVATVGLALLLGLGLIAVGLTSDQNRTESQVVNPAVTTGGPGVPPPPEPPPLPTPKVPTVIGTSKASAVATIESAGYQVEVVRSRSDAPAEQVFRQSPGGGSELERGGWVTLSVSLGQPAQVVQWYHDALESHDFGRAFGYLTPSKRRQLDNGAFRNGYADTAESNPENLRTTMSGDDTAEVACTIVWRNHDGRNGRNNHTYVLVRQNGDWRISRINGE